MGLANPRTCLTLALLAGLQQVPAAGSPFQDLWRLEPVNTSRDEYTIWAHWNPDSWSVKYPGRRPIDSDTMVLKGNDIAVLTVTCRVDGRPTGHLGPRPADGLMSLPLHPDEPNAATAGNPWFWILGMSGRDTVRTDLQVTLSSGGAHATAMVRRRTAYGNYRPTVDFDLDARAALTAMAENRGMRLVAEGEDTSIDVNFPANNDLRAAAALMLEHCPFGD